MEDYSAQTFGNRVETIRKSKGLSLRTLASLAEMEHHQILNIEKGITDLRLSTILKLAKALEVGASEFFR